MPQAQRPPQQQSHQPGSQEAMTPEPQGFMEHYLAAGKLRGKNALITGGDSGIGRAVAIGFAKEGANVAICYLDEEEDARITREAIEAEGVKCLTLSGDIGNPETCREIAEKALKEFGSIDILVNNAAEQHVAESIEEISPEQLQRTFSTNIFSMFYLTQVIVPQMKEGSSIINTASITAYKGKQELIDYASTKGAIVAFTRSLSQSLAEKGIRVNAVAPGPIWTPLIPASFDAEQVATFGSETPLGRAGQPDEVAPAYIFLASQDAAYITGQVIHPNGGTVVNS
jgi:NAD(P)-dependent dehydrogenase (short-subunit alcohol dehydrogenase family)